MLVILKKNFSILQIAKMVKKVFNKCPIIVLNNPSHDERSYKVNFELLSKDFSDIIDFKNKNIIEDIKKLKLFFKKKVILSLRILFQKKTNRIFKLKRLIKTKKINKNLRFI